MNDDLALLVRERRDRAGLSQAQLAERLGVVGVPVSRSHLANFEAGRFSLRPDQLAALDAILALNQSRVDELVADAVSPAGVATEVAWSLIQPRFGEATPGHFPRLERNETRAFDSVGEVDECLEGLLAAAERAPHNGGRLLIVGWPTAEPSLNITVSELHGRLVRLMAAGYQCVHVLPQSEDSFTPIRVAASLLACSKYTCVVAEGPSVPSHGLIVVDSGAEFKAAMQLFRDSANEPVGRALLTSSPQGVEFFARLVDEVARNARPLVGHFGLSPAVARQVEFTTSELQLFRELTSRAARGDWITWSIGWLPNCFVSEDVFKRRLETRLGQSLRHAAETNGVNDAVRDELVVLHAARRHAFLGTLERQQTPVRILVTRRNLDAFFHHGTHYASETPARSVPKWRRFTPDEVTNLGLELADLLREYGDCLEIGVADHDRIDQGLANSKFEARGGRNGYAVVQTRTRDSQNGDLANLILDHEFAAIGFKAIFDVAWRTAEKADADRVLRELRART